MFRTITARIGYDADYPSRYQKLKLLALVRDGKLYDHLPYAFHEERSASGEYVRLLDRRPSVRSCLCRVVVDDSVSLLFSEGHFPGIDCADDETKKALTILAKESCLNQVMIEAATFGSVGSVAILMRVLKNRAGDNRVFFTVMPTDTLTPRWRSDEPDALACVTEQYKVKGATLKASGYDIPDDCLGDMYWFRRDWDEETETWYRPWAAAPPSSDEPAEPVIDAERTVKHGLGFVPVVWIKNLPGGDASDGMAGLITTLSLKLGTHGG